MDTRDIFEGISALIAAASFAGWWVNRANQKRPSRITVELGEITAFSTAFDVKVINRSAFRAHVSGLTLMAEGNPIQSWTDTSLDVRRRDAVTITPPSIAS